MAGAGYLYALSWMGVKYYKSLQWLALALQQSMSMRVELCFQTLQQMSHLHVLRLETCLANISQGTFKPDMFLQVLRACDDLEELRLSNEFISSAMHGDLLDVELVVTCHKVALQKLQLHQHIGTKGCSNLKWSTGRVSTQVDMQATFCLLAGPGPTYTLVKALLSYSEDWMCPAERSTEMRWGAVQREGVRFLYEGWWSDEGSRRGVEKCDSFQLNPQKTSVLGHNLRVKENKAAAPLRGNGFGSKGRQFLTSSDGRPVVQGARDEEQYVEDAPEVVSWLVPHLKLPVQSTIRLVGCFESFNDLSGKPFSSLLPENDDGNCCDLVWDPDSVANWVYHTCEITISCTGGCSLVLGLKIAEWVGASSGWLGCLKPVMMQFLYLFGGALIESLTIHGSTLNSAADPFLWAFFLSGFSQLRELGFYMTLGSSTSFSKPPQNVRTVAKEEVKARMPDTLHICPNVEDISIELVLWDEEIGELVLKMLKQICQ
ncbi:hypothetical protein BV20DRAFT_979394 [Pilatotrama ljubarskyi]|nr:hypothetical protein BV20DRAFT_979394 [Pilatotrama ljubarskyi]